MDFDESGFDKIGFFDESGFDELVFYPGDGAHGVGDVVWRPSRHDQMEGQRG